MRWDLVFFYSIPVAAALLWYLPKWKNRKRKQRVKVVRKVTFNNGLVFNELNTWRNPQLVEIIKHIPVVDDSKTN